MRKEGVLYGDSRLKEIEPMAYFLLGFAKDNVLETRQGRGEERPKTD